uniref:Signal recognition particle subunit SRP68 n=1 Tax=Aceria tosichella TaxID=561515 RepID=A0A6G1SFI2_9ACAR
MSTAEEAMDVTPTLDVNLPVYEYVRDAQLQHGLKYDDHRQYRSYCSRRIHRIRRSLNVHQGIAPSAKARHQRGRKLMAITNVMVLEAGQKVQEYAERMLVIPLFLAERAWSYSMQLKQEITECPRKRFHLVRRLEKADQHANRFEKLCHDPESPCTERTKKEATAYAAYMRGLYKMEREDWAGAKEAFYNCLVLYTALSLSVTKESVLEQYRLRIDELKASLRYCTFTLGEKPKEYKLKLPTTLQFHDIAFRHAKQVQEQESKSAQATPASPKKATETVTVTGDDDEDDEFEETQEAMADEESGQDGETEESDDDDDNNKQQQQSRGGVTGLVKGWLGGAWS